MYDIYALLNHHRLPDFSILANNPVLQKALHHLLSPPHQGFLGLNLSGDSAAEFLEQLIQAGGYGEVVPAAYRQPKVTLEMARLIAEKAFQQETRFPGVRFEPVQFMAEDALWWKFGAPSPEWIEDGVIPGVLHFLVDKLDGHLWTTQEQVCLSAHGEEYYLQCVTTLKPQQILDLLALKLGLTWGTDYRHRNKACLKGPALVVSAIEHTSPDFYENTFGIRPTIRVDFRIIPYKSGNQSAPQLMLRAVMSVCSYSTEAILFWDNGTLATLLHSKAGELELGEEWSHWASSRNLSPTPFLIDLPSLLATQAWRGIPAPQKMPDGKDRWNGMPAPVRQPHYKIDRSKLAAVAT